MNVVMTSVGSAGDVLPFIRIGAGLKARGHDVTMMSHCHYEPLAVRAGLDFVALDSIEEYRRFLEDGALLNTPFGIAEFIRRHSLSQIPVHVELVTQRCRPGETVLITRDMFDTAARIAAEKLGIPALWMFIAPSQLTTWKIRVDLFRDQLAAEINALRTQIGLPPINDWEHWLGYPKFSIALWPDWFAAPDPTWPAGVVPVGFANEGEAESEPLPQEVRGILDAGASPILITGGTGMYLTSDFFSVSSAACQLLDRTAILITPHEKLLPARLPQTVHWFKRLPLGQLMPYVGAVIHHGGIGTTACAIASGVPQLVLPHGADRPDNARRLQGLGIAEFQPLARWHPDIVAGTLRRLLTSSVVRVRCEELALRLGYSDALGAACELVEKSWANKSLSMDYSPALTAANVAAPKAKAPLQEQNTDLLSTIPGGLSQERLELLARLIGKKSAGANLTPKIYNRRKNTGDT
jgi:rhamnosyltransferase subunit B